MSNPKLSPQEQRRNIRRAAHLLAKDFDFSNGGKKTAETILSYSTPVATYLALQVASFLPDEMEYVLRKAIGEAIKEEG